MQKYYFTFSGCVEIAAESKESAENVFIKLNQFELADNFTDLECTEAE